MGVIKRQNKSILKSSKLSTFFLQLTFLVGIALALLILAGVTIALLAAILLKLNPEDPVGMSYLAISGLNCLHFITDGGRRKEGKDHEGNQFY